MGQERKGLVKFRVRYVLNFFHLMTSVYGVFFGKENCSKIVLYVHPEFIITVR